MQFQRIPKLFGAFPLVSILFLGGCVAGQTIGLDYSPEGARSSSRNVSVNVSVADSRAYVADGSKNGVYIGTYRGGFGNTFDVKSGSGEPLATIVKRDLSADLKALGFDVTEGNAARKVRVTINEWKFDAYTSATYWYDITVAILDAQNRALKQNTLKDSVSIEGSVMTGAKSAVEREVPKLYREVIRKMVRENSDLLRALQ